MHRGGWAARAVAAVKALGLPFGGRGGGRGLAPYDVVTQDWPSGGFDYASAAGDPWENGAVAVCLGWIGDNVAEPALRVMRRGRAGVAEPVMDHPLLRLARRPNPFYDWESLLAATAMSYAADGNAYWLKARGGEGNGRPRELWFVPHWQIGPRWPRDGSEFISDYLYRVEGREYAVPREDVVHFRNGIDRANPRLGQSRLAAVLREVCADNQATVMTAALLRNMGVPGCMISPASDAGTISEDQAKKLAAMFQARLTGEGAGRPFVSSGPVRVERLGFSPEELALDRIRHVPEARICAALRIPAMVAGLSVGDEQRTYANFAVARRAAYEDCLLPMQRRIARAIDRQLLPDFGDADRDECDWDYSRVAALAPDLTEVYRRNNLGVAGGWMTVAEARERAGLRVMPGMDRLGGEDASDGNGDQGPPRGAAGAGRRGAG